MKRYRVCFLLFLSLALMCGGVVPTYATPAYQQREPVAHTATWKLSTVVDWQRGFTDDVLISNNDDGELRLDAEQSSGVFVSRPYSATFALNAVGAIWRAQFIDGASLLLELRTRTTPPNEQINTFQAANDEPGWSEWYPLVADDARSQADDGAFATPNVVPLPPDTRYLQLRATFTSSIEHASAILNEVTIAYFNTMQGPLSIPASHYTPLLTGASTLTARPDYVPRTLWSASRPAVQPTHATPRGIMLYHIDMPVFSTPAPNTTTPQPLPLLRALATYQTDILGWDDMAYHYLIDQQGILYEGRMGGAETAILRLSGGDRAIHVGILANRNDELSPALVTTLTNLLAWLTQAYDISPTGTHSVVQGDEVLQRQNIVGHAVVVRAASDDMPTADDPLHALLPTLRSSVDTATTRSRWYFAEGNTAYGYHETFMLFNTSDTDATAAIHIKQVRATSPITYTVTVPALGNARFVLNDVMTNTDSLSTIIDANEAVIAERSMALSSDISVKTGIPELSRIWYFAEGTTAENFSTYLILFNPHAVDTEAIITYMQGDGVQAQQKVVLPAHQRQVLTVNDVLPGVGFGTRIVARHPIAAERTMRFGPHESGMHMGPGSTHLSRTWYFAEGTTNPPFFMRLLVLNPNDQACNTTITFMTPDGTSLKRNYAIPPTTRLVVDVNEVVPAIGIATVIESDRPIAAERALYFDAQALARNMLLTHATSSEATDIADTVAISETTETTDTAVTTQTLEMISRVAPMAGMVSFGAQEPAYVWYFTYGTTLGANEYILLSNPGRFQAMVTVDVVRHDGNTDRQHMVMPPGSRYTFAMHDFYPNEPSLSAVVSSTQPLVAERSIFAIGELNGGTTSPGIPVQ